MEEQITETGTDGLTAPSADELRAVEEISEEAQQEMAREAGIEEQRIDEIANFLNEWGNA